MIILLIGCNTLSFATDRDDIQAMETLAAAGFKSIDLNLNKYAVRSPISPFWQADEGARISYAFALKQRADELGMTVGQVHSPYPTFFENEDKTADVIRVTKSSIEIAAALGAPYMVIHPNVPPSAKTAVQVEEAVENNFGFFSLFFEDLKRTGLCIGVENMFNWEKESSRALPTVASTADCMAYMVDRLNEMCGEKHFVACLDTGHAMLSGGGDPAAMVRTLGKRLKLLHVHDNDAMRDRHWLPFKGVINWAELAASLAEVGYMGNLSLEIKMDGDEAEAAYAAAYKLKKMIEKEQNK